MNEWGKTDCLFLLGSSFKPKEPKSLAPGAGMPALWPFGAFYPAIPQAAFCAQYPSWGHCQLETQLEPVQSPSTTVEAVLLPCRALTAAPGLSVVVEKFTVK